MERDKSLGFQNATDQATYEAEYDHRAKQHREEELEYLDNRLDTNIRLFESVRHGVLIAGFKHSRKKDGISIGRNISDAAMAGFCGQLYTADFLEWCRQPRVGMAIRAFYEVETSELHPCMVDSSSRRPAGVWRVLNNTPHIDLLRRHHVELAINDLTSTTDQAGMVTLIGKLPLVLSETSRAVDLDKSLGKKAKEHARKDISYVAKGIQLARFQQALLHTSNGNRFFPGKAYIAGTPGRRLFEDFIEIEDMSRALEVFVMRKNRNLTVSRVKGELAQKPYYYPHTMQVASEATKLTAGDGNDRKLPEREGTGELVDDQTPAMTAMPSTPLRSVDPVAHFGSRVESVEPSTHVDGGNHQTPADVESDEETVESLKQTDEDLRKLESDKTQLETRKLETMQKQKDGESKISQAKQKQKDDQDRLRACEEELARVKKELKDDEDNLQGLELVRQESVGELKKVEKKAKLLSVDVALARNKRKRAELEHEERLAKELKQALEMELDDE